MKIGIKMPEKPEIINNQDNIFAMSMDAINAGLNLPGGIRSGGLLIFLKILISQVIRSSSSSARRDPSPLPADLRFFGYSKIISPFPFRDLR
jgi:hypothetical protein